jgi:hypothetical protein
MESGEGKTLLSHIASCGFSLLGYQVFLIKKEELYT